MKDRYRTMLLTMVCSGVYEEVQAVKLYEAILKLNAETLEEQRLKIKESGTTPTPNTILRKAMKEMGNDKSD